MSETYLLFQKHDHGGKKGREKEKQKGSCRFGMLLLNLCTWEQWCVYVRVCLWGFNGEICFSWPNNGYPQPVIHPSTMSQYTSDIMGPSRVSQLFTTPTYLTSFYKPWPFFVNAISHLEPHRNETNNSFLNTPNLLVIT